MTKNQYLYTAGIIIFLCAVATIASAIRDERNNRIGNRREIVTLEDGGHKWVTTYYAPRTLVHHPDCPCGKVEK